jgi:hypothetical protein
MPAPLIVPRSGPGRHPRAAPPHGGGRHLAGPPASLVGWHDAPAVRAPRVAGTAGGADPSTSSGSSRARSKNGGRLRLIALIDETAVIARILRHLGLPTEIPAARPARAPALDGARAALSEVEGRPARSRAVPGAPAARPSSTRRSSSTRAADRMTGAHTRARRGSRGLGVGRRPAGSRLHRRRTGAAPVRRRASAGPCDPWGHDAIVSYRQLNRTAGRDPTRKVAKHDLNCWTTMTIRQRRAA